MNEWYEIVVKTKLKDSCKSALKNMDGLKEYCARSDFGDVNRSVGVLDHIIYTSDSSMCKSVRQFDSVITQKSQKKSSQSLLHSGMHLVSVFFS